MEKKERKMKTINIDVYGIEKFLDFCLKKDDLGVLALSGFSRSCTLTFTLEDGTEYSPDDFCQSSRFDTTEFYFIEEYFNHLVKEYEGKDTVEVIRQANKATATLEIEIPEDEEFDPKKAFLARDCWIYPDEIKDDFAPSYEKYEEIVTRFVYDNEVYDLYVEDSTGICGKTIWPADEDDEDDED